MTSDAASVLRAQAIGMLRDAQDGVELASGNLDRALETRRFWIRRALEAGERPADIARALRLTRARVTQIARQD